MQPVLSLSFSLSLSVTDSSGTLASHSLSLTLFKRDLLLFGHCHQAASSYPSELGIKRFYLLVLEHKKDSCVQQSRPRCLAVEIVKAVKPKLKSKYILEMDHIHVCCAVAAAS